MKTAVYDPKGEPRLDDPTQLPWKRKWRCPQCDANGVYTELGAIDWHDHLTQHTVNELREVAQYAMHYRSALEMILSAVRNLPVDGFAPSVVYHKIQWEAERVLGWKAP